MSHGGARPSRAVPGLPAEAAPGGDRLLAPDAPAGSPPRWRWSPALGDPVASTRLNLVFLFFSSFFGQPQRSGGAEGAPG